MAVKELSVTVAVPETHVMISKEEYNYLVQQEIAGRYWDMRTLENKIGYKRQWIEEKILYKPSFKKLLDVDATDEGFVKYPSGKSRKWAFQASKMIEFLEDKFPEIMKGED